MWNSQPRAPPTSQYLHLHPCTRHLHFRHHSFYSLQHGSLHMLAERDGGEWRGRSAQQSTIFSNDAMTMPQRTTCTSIFLCILFLLTQTALARHAHRRPLHRHAARQEPTSTIPTTITVISASPTAANAIMDDMEKIQEGIGGLPDLLSFIIALDERLKELEKMVADYINNPGNGPVSPVGPVLSPAPPEVTPVPIDEPSVGIVTTSIALQSDASDEPPPPEVTPGQAEEPSIDINTTSTPLQSDGTDEQTSTRTTRITLTMTSRITTTQELASVTNAVDETSYPPVNTTDFEPPAPWTKPYRLTTSAEDWTVTYTFAEETSTSFETGISTPIETPATLSTSPPTPSSYTFDASSEDNVAIYYGTTPKTEIGGLASLCANPNVDIVILSFLSAFFDANGQPSIDFGPGCSDPTPTQATLAPGLKDCSALAQEIAICQSIGKKVLLSLGGYNSNTSFTSSQQASDFASTLWDLFGGGNGTSSNPDLRPFGPDVRVDGFDIDNENHRTDHYETFTTALRAKLDSDSSKTYYLSAAPQCPIPDESIPLGALLQADFVFVQFYNNPSCNLDSAGFQESFRRWSSLLGEGTVNALRPRLYVGAAGFEGAGSGYVKGSGLGTRVRTARELYVDNLGGVMIWDGSEAGANLDQYGVSYLEYAKAALH